MTDQRLVDAFGTPTIYVDAMAELSHTDKSCERGLFPTTQWEGRGAEPCEKCCPEPGVIGAQAAPAVPATSAEIQPPATLPVQPEPQPQEAKALTPGQEVAAWLLGLDSKVTDDMMNAHLQEMATCWAERYTGDFEFMIDMKAAADRARNYGETLSVKKARGVLNCWRAELKRNR
jgi:hypothetical protein